MALTIPGDEPRMVTAADVMSAASVTRSTLYRDKGTPGCPLNGALYRRKGDRQATCTLEVQRRYIAWREALPPVVRSQAS